MKKIISVILLCSLLLISLAGCKTEKQPDIMDNESWLILDLVDYLYQLKVQYDMIGLSFEDQIDEIKDCDKTPLHVGYTSSNYYFICGYYNISHEYSESGYCCASEYTWLKFDNEAEIIEYYNGEKFVVGFQFNRPLFVDNILSERERVPNVEHFQLYEPEFSDGSNVKDPIVFEDTSYIFLTSSDRRHIYHTNDRYNHRNVTIPCTYLDDQFYIMADLPKDSDGNLKEYNFGKYYDKLTCVIDTLGKEHIVTNESGGSTSYGLIAIDAFVDEVITKSAELTANDRLILNIKSKVNTNNGTIAFKADTFTQAVYLSSLDSIDVKIEKNKVYLNGVLYDKAEYISNPDVTYSQGLISGIDTATGEALEKIKNSDSCYILKNEKVTSPIAVYDIDGVYYFLSFSNDNEVIRIHSAKL